MARCSHQHYTIKDILVFPQEVTAASVRPPAEEYTQWLCALPREVRTTIAFHGHSHVNMGTSPSATDTKYQEDVVKQMESGYYIFFIINKKNEVFAKLYDVDNNLVYDTADLDIVADIAHSKLGWADAQIKEHVKEEPKVTYTYAQSNRAGYETTWERARRESLEAQGRTANAASSTTPSTTGKSTGKGYGKPGRPTKAEEAARRKQIEEEEQAAQVDNMVRNYHKATPGSSYDSYLRAVRPDLFSSATTEQEREY